jgi:hypothetical protein
MMDDAPDARDQLTRSAGQGGSSGAPVDHV